MVVMVTGAGAWLRLWVGAMAGQPMMGVPLHQWTKPPSMPSILWVLFYSHITRHCQSGLLFWTTLYIGCGTSEIVAYFFGPPCT